MTVTFLFVFTLVLSVGIILFKGPYILTIKSVEFYSLSGAFDIPLYFVLWVVVVSLCGV